MKLCIRDGRWDLALDMVGHKEWAVSDVRLHHMAIMACRRGARWEEALSVVESMKTKGLERDGAVYASAIAVCGAAGQWAKGVQLLEEAVADWPYGLTPNMFNAAISTCCRGEAWEMVTRVVGLMEQHGVAWDSYTYSALMDAYAKSGRPDEALQLFDKMVDQGVQADRVAYTVAMSLYVRQGQFDKVLQLFKRMRGEGVEPDGHTYAAAITACSGGANVEKEVLDLLADYRRSRHRPSRLVYVAAVVACAREGHWKGAMRVLEQMVEAKVLPEFWTFAAATEACTNRGVWAETLGMLQASSGRGRFVGREEYDEVMQRAAGAARERCGSSAQLSQDLVATQALQAEEKDLWTAVVGCQNKNRWRRLVSLVERLQEAGKAEAVVSKGKKRGRAAMAKGLAVQLPHALVLTGVRLGLLREALEMFNALEKVAEPLGEEGAAEREMVHRVLVRGLLQHKDGWALPLEALRDELEAPQVKRKSRGAGAKRGGDKPGRGLEAYKLAVELCSRARQWQALEAVLELYRSRHGSDAVLVDVAKAVVEEMGILGVNKPQGRAVGEPSKEDQWGARENGQLDDMTEVSSRSERPSRGASGVIHLDDLSEDTEKHGLKTRSNSIIRLDDLSDESASGEMPESSGIVHLDDLSEETPSDGERQEEEATEVVGQRELQ
jgi:pentatricopeptide repeat protein